VATCPVAQQSATEEPSSAIHNNCLWVSCLLSKSSHNISSRIPPHPSGQFRTFKKLRNPWCVWPTTKTEGKWKSVQTYCETTQCYRNTMQHLLAIQRKPIII
jgi:hypothetical protein